MNRLILAFAPLLIGARLSCAETPNCLPQPTRACVFQMALAQANDENKLSALAEGYLAVAYLQEQEQTGEASETRAALLARLLPAKSDPLAASKALNMAAGSLFYSSDIPVTDLPETNHWIDTTLADLNRLPGLPDPAPWKRTPPELQERISAKVAAAPADLLPRYFRLTAAGRPEFPRLDVGVVVLPSKLTKEHYQTLKGLFAKGALTGARAEIAFWDDAEQRGNGYAALALVLARAGEVQQALQLTLLPELTDDSALDFDAKFDLVETWARAGDGTKAGEILERMGYPTDWSSAKEAEIIAAMVTGDIGKARDLLATLKVADGLSCLEVAIDAVLDQRPDRVEALLAMLPPDQKTWALLALGTAQIRIGDVEGVQQTLERLEWASDDPYYTWALRSQLPPVLAATGHAAEAVQMAADMSWPKITALVAAQIE